MTAPQLSPRELAVLTLIAQGRSQRETAAQLGISRNLVRTCLGTCLAKLGAAHLPHAVALAIRDGLITPEQIPAPHQPGATT